TRRYLALTATTQPASASQPAPTPPPAPPPVEQPEAKKPEEKKKGGLFDIFSGHSRHSQKQAKPQEAKKPAPAETPTPASPPATHAIPRVGEREPKGLASRRLDDAGRAPRAKQRREAGGEAIIGSGQIPAARLIDATAAAATQPAEGAKPHTGPRVEFEMR